MGQKGGEVARGGGRIGWRAVAVTQARVVGTLGQGGGRAQVPERVGKEPCAGFAGG